MRTKEPSPYVCERKIQEVRLIRMEAGTGIAELEQRCNEAIKAGFEMPPVLGSLQPGEVVILTKWTPWEDGPCDEDVGVLRPLR